MSWMRIGYPLCHFYGVTRSYVFSHVDGYVEDYGDDYDNNPSFIELVGSFVRDATGNDEYAVKIMKVLAEKLGCLHLMRDHELTDEEEAEEDRMIRDSDDFLAAYHENGGNPYRAFKGAVDLLKISDNDPSESGEEFIVMRAFEDGHLSKRGYLDYVRKRSRERKYKIINGK